MRRSSQRGGSWTRGTIGKVHEVTGCVPISLVLERDIEGGRVTQHVHQRPKRKPAAAVFLKAQIDPHALEPRRQRLSRNVGSIRAPEIPHQKIIEVHGMALAPRDSIGQSDDQ
jgi:hypothetical protein